MALPFGIGRFFFAIFWNGKLVVISDAQPLFPFPPYQGPMKAFRGNALVNRAKVKKKGRCQRERFFLSKTPRQPYPKGETEGEGGKGEIPRKFQEIYRMTTYTTNEPYPHRTL